MPHDLTEGQAWRDVAARARAEVAGQVPVPDPPQQANATQAELDLAVAEKHVWAEVANQWRYAGLVTAHWLKKFGDRGSGFWVPGFLFVIGLFVTERQLEVMPGVGLGYGYLMFASFMCAIICFGADIGVVTVLRRFRRELVRDVRVQQRTLTEAWPGGLPTAAVPYMPTRSERWIMWFLDKAVEVRNWLNRHNHTTPPGPTAPPPPIAGRGETVIGGGRVPQMAAQAREVARADRTFTARMRNRVEDGRLIRKDKFTEPDAHGDAFPERAIQEALTEPGVRREFARPRADIIRQLLAADRVGRDPNDPERGPQQRAQEVLRQQAQRQDAVQRPPNMREIQQALAGAVHPMQPEPEVGRFPVQNPPRGAMTAEEARGLLEMAGFGPVVDIPPLTPEMWQAAREQRRLMDEQANRNHLRAQVRHILAAPPGTPVARNDLGTRAGVALRDGGQTMTREDWLDFIQQMGLLNPDEIARRTPEGMAQVLRDVIVETLALPDLTGVPPEEHVAMTGQIVQRGLNRIRPILRDFEREMRRIDREGREDRANA